MLLVVPLAELLLAQVLMSPGEPLTPERRETVTAEMADRLIHLCRMPTCCVWTCSWQRPQSCGRWPALPGGRGARQLSEAPVTALRNCVAD